MIKAKDKGITLIALIVTIIVMLILVTVTLTIALGNNGILSKAREAKNKQQMQQDYEELENAVIGAIDEETLYVDFKYLDGNLPEGWEKILGKYKSPRENKFLISNKGEITGETTGELTVPGVVFSGYYTEFNNSGMPKSSSYVAEEKILTWEELKSGVDKDKYKYNTITDTAIGDSAFEFCDSLTSIIIPGSVKNIGEEAFSECIGLTSVTIENGVESIGDWAFGNCTKLTNITMPNTIKSIGNSAFNGSTSLTNITIPSSVESLGVAAFMRCSSLATVEMLGNITEIGTSTFRFCTSLTNINIPNGVERIGQGAFGDCTSLTNITIPSSVEAIEQLAFYNCTNLTEIIVGSNNVKDIVKKYGYNGKITVK